MRNISGYIFKILLLSVLTSSAVCQDTLRTYGPRVGIDMARLAYLFLDPPETGMEASVDFELLKYLYPVLELGYSSMEQSTGQFEYRSQGIYGRAGLDYNLLHLPDKSMYHTFTAGLRYGMAKFTQNTGQMSIPSGYWGEFHPEGYHHGLTGHWLEGVVSLKTEIRPNLFLGWSIRFRILLNPDLDPLVPPRLIPGYGNGTLPRGLGLSYSLFYKIPLLKH